MEKYILQIPGSKARIEVTPDTSANGLNINVFDSEGNKMIMSEKPSRVQSVLNPEEAKRDGLFCDVNAQDRAVILQLGELRKALKILTDPDPQKRYA